ncbi:unnamed protein product [Prorocentrum cordatum]|uniref:Uncharacterized protein n=1 Tax=Prorocentrum cordatum TaxID=2364126 RepID=A0ABN9QPK5_9DINO|nr:unnamed protein product [Polarella glacialis]
MPRGSPPRCICLSRNTEVVVEPCHADAAELAVGGAPRPREATRGAPPLARSGSGQQLHRLLRPSGAVGRAAQQGLRRARGHKPAHHVQPVRPRRDPEGEAEPRGQDDAEQDHGAVPVRPHVRGLLEGALWQHPTRTQPSLRAPAGRTRARAIPRAARPSTGRGGRKGVPVNPPSKIT